MTNKEKANIYATIGTILFLVLLFLLLWFVYISAPKDIDEEGVEVAFGEVEDAGGYEAEEAEAMPMPTEAATPVQPTPSNNDLITQEDENALALQREKEKKEKEAREREEARRREEERKKKEEQERQKANINSTVMAALGNSGGGGNSSSSGPGNEPGTPGNPLGKGINRDGRIKGLEGRNTRDGKLPDITECKPSTPCRVVVQIRLDKDGNVIVSSSSNATGTNTGDADFIKCVENALKRTKWTAGPGEAVGTITYEITQKMIDNN